MKLTLRIFSGEASELFRHIHPAAQLFIGRSLDCEVCLANTSVSSRHAQLGFEAGGWWLCDQGSTNLTYLEGVALSPWHRVTLPARGTLTFGEVSVQFWVEGEGTSPTPPSAGPPPMPAPPPTPMSPPDNAGQLTQLQMQLQSAKNYGERMATEAQQLSAQLAEMREGLKRGLMYTADYRATLAQLLDELAAQPGLARANERVQEAARQIFDLAALLETLSAERSALRTEEEAWSR